MNIAIIPARGGSRRIPGKNIRLFHGKPIIAYSIETARESGLFDKIVVSTEDTRIAAVARAYGAAIHVRPAKLADDITGTQEVTKAALANWIACRNTEAPAIACCIYATAPLMSAADLKRGRGCLDVPWVQYAYSVGGNDYPFTDAGQFYWGRTEAFLNDLPLGNCREGKHLPGEGATMLVHIRKSRVCDINLESDWIRAERMYQELKADEATQ